MFYNYIMRGVGKFRVILLGFVTSILIVNPLFVCNVSAETGSDICSGAIMSRNDPLNPQQFTVAVSCSQAVSFVSPHLSEAIAAIHLNGVNPVDVGIDDKTINMLFNDSNFPSDDYKVRLLTIAPNTIQDINGIVSSDINLVTGQIIDLVKPVAISDYYEISGTSLSVNSAAGLLANDDERESSVTEIEIISQPTLGTVAKLNDGSFIYTYSDGNESGDDEFTYKIKDGSGNISDLAATVTIADAEPKIKASFYNSNQPTLQYAKLGDKIMLDFSVSEKSFIDEIKICDNLIDIYENEDGGHFLAEYIVKETDQDGLCVPYIKLYDVANKEGKLQGSDYGITIDKTKPVIELENGVQVEANIHEGIDLLSEASADDINQGGDPEILRVEIDGYVDFDKVGDYKITYSAIDRAGNLASLDQFIRVIDQVNDKYGKIAQELLDYGINSNLADITSDNFENFSNLYFEKIIDGKKVGRINFIGPIDVSNYEDMFLEFSESLDTILVANNIGELGLDISGIENSSELMNSGAYVTFFNLNEIGYSNGSGPGDVIAKLSAYDNLGEKIRLNDIVSHESYVGCGLGIIDCYSFSMKVNHFSKYIIGKDTIAPVVSINKIKNYQIGEIIRLSGKINDFDATILINIDGKSFTIPRTNIKNNEWFFEANSSDLGVGKYIIAAYAVDFGGNVSAEVTDSVVIKKVDQKPNSTFVSIFTQPASILGDKLKGSTKSTTTVLDEKTDLGLDKNEIRLIIAVLILGVAILAIDRKKS